LRIGIDISILTQGGGVANYIGKLLAGLKNIQRNDQYTLFSEVLANSHAKKGIP